MDIEATKAAVAKALDGVKSKAVAPGIKVTGSDSALRITLTYSSANHGARVTADSEAIAAMAIQGLRFTGSEQADRLANDAGNELRPIVAGDTAPPPESAKFAGAVAHFLFAR